MKTSLDCNLLQQYPQLQPAQSNNTKGAEKHKSLTFLTKKWQQNFQKLGITNKDLIFYPYTSLKSPIKFIYLFICLFLII